MPNHVHLLIGTPRANLSRFMGRLLTAYAVYFNLRHHRVGHLTQGRFKAQLVEGNAYLLRLSRYIHLNPVSGKRWRGISIEAKLEALRAYPWSSYRSYVGLEDPWSVLDQEPILALVSGGRISEATAIYQSFVETGLAEDDTEFAVLYRRAKLSVGSELFNASVESQHRSLMERAFRREDVSFRRTESTQDASLVIKRVAQVLGVEPGRFVERRRNSVLRGVAAWALQRFAGLTQRDIAGCLGVGTGAAVSQQVSRWRQQMITDQKAQRIAADIERALR